MVQMVPTAVCLKLLHACDQWHFSRVSTPLTGWHCKFRLNTVKAQRSRTKPVCSLEEGVHPVCQDLYLGSSHSVWDHVGRVQHVEAQDHGYSPAGALLVFCIPDVSAVFNVGGIHCSVLWFWSSVHTLNNHPFSPFQSNFTSRCTQVAVCYLVVAIMEIYLPRNNSVRVHKPRPGPPATTPRATPTSRSRSSSVRSVGGRSVGGGGPDAPSTPIPLSAEETLTNFTTGYNARLPT
jgi:hypothetical protein